MWPNKHWCLYGMWSKIVWLLHGMWSIWSVFNIWYVQSVVYMGFDLIWSGVYKGCDLIHSCLHEMWSDTIWCLRGPKQLMGRVVCSMHCFFFKSLFDACFTVSVKLEVFIWSFYVKFGIVIGILGPIIKTGHLGAANESKGHGEVAVRSTRPILTHWGLLGFILGDPFIPLSQAGL